MEEKEIEAYGLIKGVTVGEIAEALLAFSEIGTIEECREAAAKQKPVKPIKVKDSGIRYTDDYLCPRCEKHFTGTGIAEFCYHCGQAIDWSAKAD